jgi:hypothetical protein
MNELKLACVTGRYALGHGNANYLASGICLKGPLQRGVTHRDAPGLAVVAMNPKPQRAEIGTHHALPGFSHFAHQGHEIVSQLLAFRQPRSQLQQCRTRRDTRMRVAGRDQRRIVSSDRKTNAVSGSPSG